jgi:hypothetical protein
LSICGPLPVRLDVLINELRARQALMLLDSRGGYLLDHIAAVIEQVHAAGGAGPLAASIDQWRERITARG